MPATITRDLLKVLREDINQALAAVAAKHGIVIECANGSYGPQGDVGSFKLELAAKREGAQDGATATQLRAAADWDKYHDMYNLPKDGVGKSFAYGGVKTTVLGLMPKRTKFPVFVMKGDKEVLLPADAVRALLQSAK